MKKVKKTKKIFKKIKNTSSNGLSLLDILKLFNIFMKIRKEENLEYLNAFIREYYCIEEEMPESFFKAILNQMHNGNYLSLFNVIIERNIYSLISYLTHNQEDITQLEDAITPLQYYTIPKRYINRIMESLKKLEVKDKNNHLDMILKDEL